MSDDNEIIDDAKKVARTVSIAYMLAEKAIQKLTGANANKPDDSLGKPGCDDCKELRSILQDNDTSVEKHIYKGSTEKDAIKHLQFHLDDFGYPLPKTKGHSNGIDGDYGGGTATALAAFEKEFCNNANSDGQSLSKDTATAVLKAHKNGFKTAGAQTGGAGWLADEKMDDAAKFDYYSKIITDAGGSLTPDNGATVLGLRGIYFRNPKKRGQSHKLKYSPEFDDTFVILNKNSQPTVHEFEGATHSGQTDLKDKDKFPEVRDYGIGCIKPGNYHAIKNQVMHGQDSYYIKVGQFPNPSHSDKIPGWRVPLHKDFDYVLARDDHPMTQVCFHCCPEDKDQPWSLSCQTFAYKTFTNFIQWVGGRDASFNYTLVDAYGSQPPKSGGADTGKTSDSDYANKSAEEGNPALM